MRKLHTNGLNARRWMIVDNFAGGGGASTGIKWAVGRDPDAAINHDPEALAMYRANHPHSRVYATDVFEIDPAVVTRDKDVGLAWFSPDCTHHSKARGGKPIREPGKKSRALAWVVVRWAEKKRPRVIMLENVEEFANWGPLIKKVDKQGRPVLDKHGKQVWIPCPARKGKTFKRWVRALEKLGYRVEWKQLRACDYGSPTIRNRLFLIARRDQQPIVWPKQTHGKPDSQGVKSGQLLPWRTAAEIIDWSLTCPSIFLTTEEGRAIGCKRPLEENTMKRIAAGLKRYVIDSANPFIVCCNHGSGDRFRGQSIHDPMSTVTGSKGDALVTPFSVPRYTERPGQEPRSSSIDAPAATIVPTGNGQSLVTPFLASPAHSKTTGRAPNHWPLDEPVRTVTSSNDKCVIAPILTAYHGERNDGSQSRSIEMGEPIRTVDTQNRFGVVAGVLSREFGNSVGSDIESPAPTVMPGGGGKTGLVQAFLAQHNTGMVGHPADEPLSTITLRGTQQNVVEATFMSFGQHGGRNRDTSDPMPTITASTKDQHQLAAAILSHSYTSNTNGGNGDPNQPLKTVVAGGQHHACVKAFLQKYYKTGGQHSDCRDPVHTISTVDRMGVVTVDEIDYEIVDIGMRMLSARELFRAQGFEESYIIDVPAPNPKGKMRPLPKDAQVRMCGNSVCPQVAAALVAANCPWLREKPRKKRQRQLELAGV